MLGDDRWSRWVLDSRFAGLDQQRDATRKHLEAVRDRVIAAAGPLQGATVLDVGCGDGLIGLTALNAVGREGEVVFCDISDALLDECRSAVLRQKSTAKARFIRSSVSGLAGIGDGSMDAVTMRSVLLYVHDKPTALASIRRVLRPGGRLSIFEPINRLMLPEPNDRFWGYDVSGVDELATRVKKRFHEMEAPGWLDVMMDFDDRDLLQLMEAAGFEHLHVECHMDVEHGSLLRPISLDALLGIAPNPNAPTIAEAARAALTEEELRRFMGKLSAAFENKRCVRREAVVYASASKALS
jgi:arsenite methyltransferase